VVLKITRSDCLCEMFLFYLFVVTMESYLRIRS